MVLRIFMSKIVSTFLFTLCLLFLLTSIILNPQFIGKRFSADKELNNQIIEFEINFVRIILFTFGILLLFNKTRTEIIRFLKNKRKEIILLLVVLVISAFMAEGILRIYDFQIYRFKTQDLIYHHILIPNSFGIDNALEYKTYYYINSFGFRDKEYTLEKPNNTFRIIMLGDSYTEGMGVQQNEAFSKILENRLNIELKYSNLSFEVINKGVMSWTTVLHYLWIKNEGVKFKPDLVILNFDNNDIAGDIIMEKVSKYDDNNTLIAVDGTIDNPSETTLFKRLNSNKFYLFNAIKRFHLSFTKNDLKGYNSEKFGQIFFEPNFTEEKCFGWHGDLRKGVARDTLLFTRDNYTKDDLKYYENSLNYAVKLNNILKEKNISFIFTTYPYGHQVSTNEWVEGRKFLCAEPEKVYSIESCSFAENYLIQKNISVFNTCPLFRGYSGTEKLFYSIDSHFNVNGHKFMADLYFERIKEFLYEKGIV